MDATLHVLRIINLWDIRLSLLPSGGMVCHSGVQIYTTTGRLRDTSTDSIVRMLRLFNLCDIGPAGDDARRRGPSGTPLASPAATSALPLPPALATSHAMVRLFFFGEMTQ